MSVYEQQSTSVPHRERDSHEERGIRHDSGDRMASAAREIRDDASTVVSEVGQTLRAEAERVADLARSGGDQAQEVYQQACGIVRRHPTAVVLGVLGLGVIIGRVIARR